MPMTHIPLSGIETETDSISSKTSTLQDIVDPSIMSNTQRDILQIIRKEEDHAMSLLAASPLLSSLFLTYANRAATLDGPPAPSPIDVEWTEMKSLNNRLQEEVTLLRAQLTKETDRAEMAEDCVEALRSQLSSVKDANRDLEVAVSHERTRLETITAEYAKHKKETEGTITELRNTVDKETGARAALSQVIADQQITLAQLKEWNDGSSPSPPTTRRRPAPPTGRISLPDPPSPVKRENIVMQIGAGKSQDEPEQPKGGEQRDNAGQKDPVDPCDENQQDVSGHRDSVKLHGPVRTTGERLSLWDRKKLRAASIEEPEVKKADIDNWF